MIKKHLHHFSRGLVIGFEILGGLALFAFVAWLALILRLSQGPLDVDFLTINIDKSFNKQQSDFKVSVGSTMLTWGGAGQHFIFDMNRVQIARTDGTPVLAVNKIGVQLSKRHLIFGELIPRVIRIYGPALRIVHGEDGHFTLNVNDAEPAAAAAVGSVQASPAIPDNTTPDKKNSQMEFIKDLLGQMKDSDRSTLLGGLDEVSVSDAALLYEDKVLNVQWKSGRSNIVIDRVTGGLAVDTLVNIAQNATHVATIRGNFRYSWLTRNSSGTVTFTNFNPALVAQQSATLKTLAGMDMPLKGTLSLSLDPDFNPGYGRFALGADPGKFSAPDIYPEPIPIKTLYVQGKFNFPTGEMALEQLTADLDGPKITATGSIVQQAAGHAITVNATLEDMPLDKLKTYWPASLTPDPRAWITGHLSAGTATKATLDLALLSPHVCTSSCANPWNDFAAPQVQKVSGQIDFNNIKVDYFPPLMPVTKVKGKATYDQKSFNLDIASGELGDMQVTGSKIAITDLDVANEKVHSRINVDVSLKGPLKTAMKMLNSPPLQYPEKLGLQAGDVMGDAKIDVNFKFPLYAKLTLVDLKVTAKAQLDNVLLKGAVAGMSLAGGPMVLSLHDNALDVSGKGTLGAMPVTFDWLRNFSSTAAVATKVDASLPLDAAALKTFGMPDELKVTGMVPAKVIYTVGNDDKASLLFKGDITPAGFTLPVAGYEKIAGTTGTLDMSLQFKDGQLTKISGLDLKTDKAQLKGDMTFLSDGKTLKTANFSQVKLNNNDISLVVESHGSDGYDVNATGAQFDASAYFTENPAPNSDTEAAKKTPPVSLAMNVDRFITGKDKSISRLQLTMKRNMWNRLDQLSVDGIAGGQPLKLRYMPTAQGHTLNLEADNAGAALSTFNISEGVRGGKLVINGLPNPQDAGKRNMHGTVMMTDFSLANAPILGKVLNALSLGGFLELMNGKGIAFKKMRSDFTFTDAGQPDTPQNVRLITFKNGQTSGASLGLTFEGKVDNWNNTLDLSGTIIPVSDLNKMLAVIPLVGDILTGGGKGIFAATYTVKGPKNQPTVSVNPLSVLAPGILRKLFFEKND
jgi:hypothetical protein